MPNQSHYEDDALFDDELFLTGAAASDARLRRYQDQRLKTRRPPRRSSAEVTDLSDTAGDFKTTYTPARFEVGWLREALRTFYDDRLIVDVLAQIKGGKEANVYRCQAHPDLGDLLLAVKVYRPRQFRNLRNDARYREGRTVLSGRGQPISPEEHRVMRALAKKTDFGEEVRHQSWLMHEFTTLQRLHRAGAAVPEPIAAAGNAIVMGYIGDAASAAPTLNAVQLPRAEAAALWDEALHTVEVLLAHGLVHGDLSAYNILYWEGAITVIDFPQVVDVAANPHARAILGRDLARVCDYFARQGVAHDPAALADTLWLRYVGTSDE